VSPACLTTRCAEIGCAEVFCAFCLPNSLFTRIVCHAHRGRRCVHCRLTTPMYIAYNTACRSCKGRTCIRCSTVDTDREGNPFMQCYGCQRHPPTRHNHHRRSR
jgi:hypothetical protein